MNERLINKIKERKGRINAVIKSLFGFENSLSRNGVDEEIRR